MDTSITLPVAFLIFGAIIVALEIWVLARKNQGFGPQAVRMIGVTIAIVVACALATTNLTGERITAVLTLVGTLAGYLAGKADVKAE